MTSLKTCHFFFHILYLLILMQKSIISIKSLFVILCPLYVEILSPCFPKSLQVFSLLFRIPFEKYLYPCHRISFHNYFENNQEIDSSQDDLYNLLSLIFWKDLSLPCLQEFLTLVEKDFLAITCKWQDGLFRNDNYVLGIIADTDDLYNIIEPWVIN